MKVMLFNTLLSLQRLTVNLCPVQALFSSSASEQVQDGYMNEYIGDPLHVLIT